MTNISMYRGDSKLIRLYIKDEANADYNLSSCKVWFTAKASKTQQDIDALMLKSTDDDITVVDSVGGELLVEFFPADTDSLTAAGSYFYDIQLKDASGRVWTVGEGTLNVLLDITRTTA
jgi:hypothetical protein